MKLPDASDIRRLEDLAVSPESTNLERTLAVSNLGAACRQATAENAELRRALGDLLEAIHDEVDTIDGNNGVPTGNWACDLLNAHGYTVYEAMTGKRGTTC